MYVGYPPFEYATLNNQFFQFLVNKNYKMFWKAHSKKKSNDFFSESFKSLFEKMTAYNADERITVKEIFSHPWMKEPICMNSEIRSEFDERMKKLSECLE